MSDIYTTHTSTQMSGYTQHIPTTPLHKNNRSCIQVECEKTGTIFWQNSGTNETAWTLEQLQCTPQTTPPKTAASGQAGKKTQA